jgi:amino-acid N-acetyltransferase
MQTNQFVEMLRNSASYISMHRGSIMVLHLPGDLIGTPAFEKTLDDIALMSLLGVKIVLVCGVAAQVCHACVVLHHHHMVASDNPT